MVSFLPNHPAWPGFRKAGLFFGVKTCLRNATPNRKAETRYPAQRDSRGSVHDSPVLPQQGRAGKLPFACRVMRFNHPAAMSCRHLGLRVRISGRYLRRRTLRAARDDALGHRVVIRNVDEHALGLNLVISENLDFPALIVPVHHQDVRERQVLGIINPHVAGLPGISFQIISGPSVGDVDRHWQLSGESLVVFVARDAMQAATAFLVQPS